MKTNKQLLRVISMTAVLPVYACVLLTGCSQEPEPDSIPSTETLAMIETATEETVEKTEGVIEEDIDALYEQYLREELSPQLGVYNVNADVIAPSFIGNSYQPNNSALQMSAGIVGYSIADMNQNNKKEMVVVYISSLTGETEGKKVMVQLYSTDEMNAVVLKDEQELLYISDSGVQRILDKISVIDSPDGGKNICVFEKQSYEGMSKKIALVHVTVEYQLILSRIVIDPGYSSGFGLYQSDTLPVSMLASSGYWDCNEIFEATMEAETEKTINEYFDTLYSALSEYDVTIQRGDWTDFLISGQNESVLFTLTLNRSYEDDSVTIRVAGNLPPDMLEMGTVQPAENPTIKIPEFTESANPVEIYSCNKTGEINGKGVAGFTTSYVCENGAMTTVRDTLGDKWHVTAVRYCDSMGLTWYELYDTDDGDYYGWVDSNYITFYNNNDAKTASSWKEAYKQVLANFTISPRYGSYSMWDLVDLDNDGIPELFVSEGMAIMDTVHLYYWTGQEAVAVSGSETGLGCMGCVTVCTEESLLSSGYYDQGIESEAIYQYANHALVKVGSFYTNEGASEAGNAVYKVNDAEVSYAEYEAALQSNYAKNWVAAGQKYVFGDYSSLDN